MGLTRMEKAKLELAHAQTEKALAEKRYADLESERIKREFKDADDSALSQRIYDFVGEVREGSVSEAIDTLTEWRHRSKRPITIRFYSPGGNVIAGLALYDYLKSLRAEGIHITTVALGYAASMAGVLLQAGDVRLIGPNAYVLIHEVSSADYGKVSEMEDYLKFTKRLQTRLLNILAERAKLTPKQIARRWKKTDYWLDADEVVALGFADAKSEEP